MGYQYLSKMYVLRVYHFTVSSLSAVLFWSSLKVGLNQNMATADRMQTTAGSWALLGSVVPKDAHIVQRLRNAGAIVLGKSNLDEWAGMRGSIYSNGYSARGGQCRNPFDLTKSPCKCGVTTICRSWLLTKVM
jgi:hypothetical protein